MAKSAFYRGNALPLKTYLRDNRRKVEEEKANRTTPHEVNEISLSRRENLIKEMQFHKLNFGREERVRVFLFIERLKECRRNVKKTETEFKNIIAFAFSDTAESWYTQAKAEFSNVKELIAALKRRFIGHSDDGELISKVQGLIQVQGESMHEYVSKIREIIGIMDEPPKEKVVKAMIWRNMRVKNRRAIGLRCRFPITEIDKIGILHEKSFSLDARTERDARSQKVEPKTIRVSVTRTIE